MSQSGVISLFMQNGLIILIDPRESPSCSSMHGRKAQLMPFRPFFPVGMPMVSPELFGCLTGPPRSRNGEGLVNRPVSYRRITVPFAGFNPRYSVRSIRSFVHHPIHIPRLGWELPRRQSHCCAGSRAMYDLSLDHPLVVAGISDLTSTRRLVCVCVYVRVCACACACEP